MSKRSNKTKDSVSKVDNSGARSGDTLEFVAEVPCGVCKEPVEFYTLTKSKKRKATTYKQHCEPHLQCIRKLLCVDMYNISELCRAFKFNRTTFYKWMKEHSELSDIVAEANEVQVECLEETLMDFATDRNTKVRSGAVRSCEILLKAKAPDKYAERIKEEHTGEVDYNVSMNSIIERKRERIKKERAGEY